MIPFDEVGDGMPVSFLGVQLTHSSSFDRSLLFAFVCTGHGGVHVEIDLRGALHKRSKTSMAPKFGS